MGILKKPEVDSPGLDSFLTGARMRRITGSALRRRLGELMYRDPPSTPGAAPDPELLPSRIMVMYRLTRQIAEVLGLTAQDETMEETTDIHPDPWTNPTLPILSARRESALRKNTAGRLLVLLQQDGGLPLLPPRDRGDDLDRWVSVAGSVAQGLLIARSIAGALVLPTYLDDRSAAQSDVTGAHVMAFEELLLSEAQDILLDVGERPLLEHLRTKYHFTRRETTNLLRLVKCTALRRGGGSIEEKRAMQEMRLEDIIARCKDTMDLAGEMVALKELGKVQGLTRTNPEDQALEFLNVVKRVAARQDERDALPDPAVQAAITAHAREAVDPVVLDAVVVDDHDDAAALTEYDEENRG